MRDETLSHIREAGQTEQTSAEVRGEKKQSSLCSLDNVYMQQFAL